MTPVLKDFMLFVDNIYEEQRWSPTQNQNKITDQLNLLSVKDGLVETTIDNFIKDNAWPKSISSNSIFRPMILFLDPGRDIKETGMVYLGPSDKTFDRSIYLNLAGIAPDSNNNSNSFDNGEVHFILPQSIGLSDNLDLSRPVSFPLGSVKSRAYGADINLELNDPQEGDKGVGSVQLGLFGFCNEVYDFFNYSSFPITTFLNDDLNVLMSSGKETYWGEIVKNGKQDNPRDFLRFTSGIKLFGLHLRTDDLMIPKRHVFGNVFGRFIFFAFWNIEVGYPLKYEIDKTV